VASLSPSVVLCFCSHCKFGVCPLQFLYLLLLIHTSTYQKKKEIISLPCDTIQARSNLDVDVKCATIQFYGNSHNVQSDRWTGLQFYMKSLGMFSYLGLKFQINQSSGRHYNTGQQRLYKFCYLLPFDLWTCYLARILFLKGCDSLFWEYPNSSKIFNGLQHSFHVWQRFINISESFLTRILYSS
jgi:hypothetical protein